MTETTIRVPAPQKAEIVGILQHSLPIDTVSSSRPLALILHGNLAHKNQLFHKQLAREFLDRGLDSYRYDLRGQGGETEGEWLMGDYKDDAYDLQTVVDYFVNLGYSVKLIVAHSRGSAITSYYLSCLSHPQIPFFVNVSGRYHMKRILEDKRYDKDILAQGYCDYVGVVAGKSVTRRVTPEALNIFASWDNGYLQTSFPRETQVLNVHGDADETIPVEDAITFHDVYSARQPGISTLTVIPGEGHTFVKPYDQVVSAILAWFDQVSQSPPIHHTAPKI